MRYSDRKIKIEFIIIFIGLALFSCNSSKNKIGNQNEITNKQNELIQLEIRLPFESSNNESENELNFKILNNQEEIIKSELDTVTKTGGYIRYMLNKGIYSYSINSS